MQIKEQRASTGDLKRQLVIIANGVVSRALHRRQRQRFPELDDLARPLPVDDRHAPDAAGVLLDDDVAGMANEVVRAAVEGHVEQVGY